MRIQVTRKVEIPDPYKLALYRKAPELGPRILFFSGGTALRSTSRKLIRSTHNTVHLITPFDSGGSSAILRKAFAMPAVGDIRNRLMALADQSVQGNPAIFDLFAYRLPKNLGQEKLRAELDQMADGRHKLVRRIPDPMRKIIRNHFHQFLEAMPRDFDLRGASIGNLVLTAGYLTNRRQLDPVIYIFSKLVQVCGTVRPTINKDLHLAVRLEDGSVIVGQHNITGKETAPLASPISDIWLTGGLESDAPVAASIRNKVRERIAGADLICYPPGSFYSSVVANLLPGGVGEAVAANPCPKVFVPGTGRDPEAVGLSVADRAALLRRYLTESGAPEGADILGYVIVDSRNGSYPGGIDRAELDRMGLTVIDCELVTSGSAPDLDERLLSEMLLSLA
ncbi:GAK system CofD-like protein [Pseudodesulfovibrio cashew]|uniref:GAK system CofD-like protein n=1 Tax=Pseudodesulfovibrio cashew TaxID=2678688 RepID=A0A6I6JLP2_9BACT|nr:GAK system CofD-like protein [Pseudodesulfovibrio cashew]QGY38644.1 GAK system CofD-like protein [Pseudodesulfovibrio cashew]